MRTSKKSCQSTASAVPQPTAAPLNNTSLPETKLAAHDRQTGGFHFRCSMEQGTKPAQDASSSESDGLWDKTARSLSGA